MAAWGAAGEQAAGEAEQLLGGVVVEDLGEEDDEAALAQARADRREGGTSRSRDSLMGLPPSIVSTMANSRAFS